jgi:hypothetical protein
MRHMGAVGDQKNEKKFFSPKWFQMLQNDQKTYSNHEFPLLWVFSSLFGHSPLPGGFPYLLAKEWCKGRVKSLNAWKWQNLREVSD